jgi:hypothetical protein
MNKPIESLDIRPPNRARHGYTQSIRGKPGEVFPLLCPVRELDWAPGWNPDWVISQSGIAEEGCVFQTPGDASAAVWYITRHQPDTHEVEMIKVTPGHTVARLEISLAGDDNGGTRAEVAYEFTSLGEAGDAFLEEFTGDWYENFMQNWEKAMNHYLKTGKLIS